MAAGETAASDTPTGAQAQLALKVSLKKKKSKVEYVDIAMMGPLLIEGLTMGADGDCLRLATNLKLKKGESKPSPQRLSIPVSLHHSSASLAMPTRIAYKVAKSDDVVTADCVTHVPSASILVPIKLSKSGYKAIMKSEAAKHMKVAAHTVAAGEGTDPSDLFKKVASVMRCSAVQATDKAVLLYGRTYDGLHVTAALIREGDSAIKMTVNAPLPTQADILLVDVLRVLDPEAAQAKFEALAQAGAAHVMGDSQGMDAQGGEDAGAGAGAGEGEAAGGGEGEGAAAPKEPEAGADVAEAETGGSAEAAGGEEAAPAVAAAAAEEGGAAAVADPAADAGAEADAGAGGEASAAAAKVDEEEKKEEGLADGVEEEAAAGDDAGAAEPSS